MISASRPDTQTDITKNALSSDFHYGRPHSVEDCPGEFSFKTKENNQDSLNDAIVQNAGSTRNLKVFGKENGNIVGNMLYDLPLNKFHPPQLHVITGIAATQMEMLYKAVEVKDKAEVDPIREVKEKELDQRITTQKFEVERLEAHIDMTNIQHMTIRKDLERHEALKQGDTQRVKELAENQWKEVEISNNSEKSNCSKYCITHSIDKEAGDMEKVFCSIGNHEVCQRCEGIVLCLGDTTEKFSCSECLNLSYEDIITRFKDKKKRIASLNNKLITDYTAAEASLQHLLSERTTVLGKHGRILEKSLKILKMNEEAYFNKTCMVGNTAHKVLDNFRDNKNELLKCIKDDPELYNKHLEMWQILAKIEMLLSKPGEKSLERREEAAQACENYTKRFPVLFKRAMTRKMHVISCVLSRDIWENGDYYKYLKLEQAGERLHNVLNQLERQYASVMNIALRYFYMLKALADKQKSSTWMFETQKRKFKKIDM